MTTPTRTQPPKPRPTAPSADRKERQAAALKRNLQRRKATSHRKPG